jgi:REP element-mobilizing transposase RayT
LTGAVYFVTWRKEKGSPDLGAAERTLVLQALLHFERFRYRLFAYVVMNDHVHALVQPLAGWELEKILHSWKSFTAHAICRLRSSSGNVWQRDYLDRIMRDEAELMEKCEYILNNPLKRWPDQQGYEWVGWLRVNF